MVFCFCPHLHTYLPKTPPCPFLCLMEKKKNYHFFSLFLTPSSLQKPSRALHHTACVCNDPRTHLAVEWKREYHISDVNHEMDCRTARLGCPPQGTAGHCTLVTAHITLPISTSGSSTTKPHNSSNHAPSAVRRRTPRHRSHSAGIVPFPPLPLFPFSLSLREVCNT